MGKPSAHAEAASSLITSKRKYAQTIGYAGIGNIDQARIIEANAITPAVAEAVEPLVEALETTLAAIVNGTGATAAEKQARAALTPYRQS